MDKQKLNQKKIRESCNNDKQDENKSPLLKIFMVEHKKRKLHLIHSTANNLRDSKWKNCECGDNWQKFPFNLQLFSFKILEAKYNSTPELYLKKKLNIIIQNKKNHFLAYMNDIIIYNNYFKEFLKRTYNYSESKERIPKYVSYYKNYLNFFCRPVFCDSSINKKMVKHMEKIAQIFYNENYADEDSKPKKNKENNNKEIIKIFSSKIFEDIENCDKCTIVNNDSLVKNCLVNNNNKIFKDDSYLITPISPPSYRKDKLLIDKNIQNTLNLLLDELSENNNSNFNPDNSDNSLSNLSKILNDNEKNNKKISIKNINKKNNAAKIKFRESKFSDNYSNNSNSNNIVLIQQGKTTNNINININHLTIAQKMNLPNNLTKILNENNPLNLKKNPEQKNLIFCFQNLTNKNKKNTNNTHQIEKIKPKSTNVGSLTLPQSSNFTENIKKLNNGFSSINNNLKENRTKSVLRGGGSLLNNGFKTSLHKYSGILRKNNSQQIPKKSAGKIFMYNNTSDYLKNMINNIKYNSNNLDINKNNNVKKNNSNNECNNLLKNSSINLLSPLIGVNYQKKNGVFKKNIGLISGERLRSTSEMKNNSNNSKIINLKNYNENSINKNNSKVKSIGDDLNTIEKRREIFNMKEERKINLKVKNLNRNKGNIHKIININFASKNNRTNSCGKLNYNY